MAGRSDFYLATLATVPGLGSRRLTALLQIEPEPERLWHMAAEELIALGKLPQGIAKGLRKVKESSPDLPQRIEKDVSHIGAQLVTINSDMYPPLLKEIFDPPMVLYYRGTVIPDAARIAIVGSRRMSGYGEALALDFSKKLAAAGLTVVSGGATGIDSMAHRGALKDGGRTVAVLGSGVDIVYPSSNRKLFSEILESGGALVSEYPPGTRPLPVFFPARNRIISGLSRGTLVVEAARHSGSLITAELAVNENRDVYAIPGSVLSDNSAGTNHLIQSGAKLVQTAEDVLEDFGIEDAEARPKRPKMTAEERLVYQVLSFDHSLSMDEIMMSLPDGDIPNLSVLLLKMEMAGLVVKNASLAYRRAERE